MAGPSAIQGPKEQASYLLFSTLAAAQQRSQQIGSAMHLDGTFTVYWYSITALTNAGTIVGGNGGARQACPTMLNGLRRSRDATPIAGGGPAPWL